MLDERNNDSFKDNYDAYTQPAGPEQWGNSVSFSYYTQPEAMPHRVVEKKRRRSPLRVIALVLALTFVLGATGVSVLFFLHYDVSVSRDAGVLSIRIVPDSASVVEKGENAEKPDLFPDKTPAENAQPDAEEPDLHWDGTKMELNAKPAPMIGEGGMMQAADTLSYAQIYAKCAPSVVSIATRTNVGSYSGTGVILSEDGYIVTCSHLVEANAEITVALQDGESYPAFLVGQDDQTDLAVLKVDAEGLPAAEFGSSMGLQVGEEVSAIGNPLGQTLTMTNGIISAIDRNVEYNGYTMTLLQTDAAINEGNSGGPLINAYGQVIGITNMKMMSHYTTVEGIGFAIPVSSAKPIVDELMEFGYIAGRPAIGIKSRDIPDAAAAYYKLPAGVLVEYVYPGTDAFEKGLQRGDVITAVEGKEIASADDLDLAGYGYKAGDEITLTVYRNGKYLEMPIILSDMALLGG